MESKGRRALRATGPVEALVQPPKTVEVPAAAIEPTEVSVESPEPAEIMADAAKPIETGANIEADARAPLEPQPNVRTPGREPFSMLAQSQAALARGLEALSAEMAGLVLSGIDAVMRTATKMLAVKTLSDAIEVNTGLARSSFDVLVGGSAKLSELGLRIAADSSQPIVSQLGKGWIKASGSRASRAIPPSPETPGSGRP